MISFRILLGLITVALVIPVAALYSQSGLSPWAEAQASPPTSDEGSPSEQPQGHSIGEAVDKGENERTGAKGSPPDHSRGKGHQHTTSSSTHSESTITNTSNSSTPTSTPLTTSTSSAPTTTTSITHDPGQVDGVITGDACPCTVMGTVALQGQINLKGDLMVMGGTLVARPGVNLNGNGFQIMFMDGGRADFQGTPVFTWSDNGRSQNLTRDINFRNLRRIMFHSGAGPSVLKYFTVSDSGTSALGDYPIHFHLNGNSTRGTIVEGVVVINGRNHAFVPHGSHGITFRDTIAKNIRNDAYWWDPPGTNGECVKGVGCDPIDNSNDILYDHALADGVTGGRRVSGFFLGVGDNVTVRNSAAINIVGSPNARFCSGFHWPEFTNGSSRGANRVWTFHNNHSYSPSGCDGIFVWQNDSFEHVIDGFSGGGIDHGAYSNKYVYRNVNVPDVLIHAAGWRMENSHAGDVTAVKHRSASHPTVVFDNVSIDSFTVDNGTDSGEIPGVYILNGSGLTCDQIIYRSVVPGTSVILDGNECP